MINLLLLITAIGIILLGAFARRRVTQLEKREVQRKHFFEAATILAQDARTPSSVLWLVKCLVATLDSKSLVYQILLDLFRGRLARRSMNPPARWREIEAGIKSLPAPLYAQFGKLVTAYVLGVSFNASVAGSFLRRIALFSLRRRFGGSPRGNDPTNVAGPMALEVLQMRLKTVC